MTQRHFFLTLHPLSSVIFATATVVAFVLFRNSRFNFHCYTQREAMPTQKSAHSCRPASLNCPIAVCLCSLSQTSLKLRLQHIYDKSLFQCVSIPCIRLHWNRLQHMYDIVSISVHLYSLYQTFLCWFMCLVSLYGVISPFLYKRNTYISLWTPDSNPKLFFSSFPPLKTICSPCPPLLHCCFSLPRPLSIISWS